MWSKHSTCGLTAPSLPRFFSQDYPSLRSKLMSSRHHEHTCASTAISPTSDNADDTYGPMIAGYHAGGEQARGGIRL